CHFGSMRSKGYCLLTLDIERELWKSVGAPPSKKFWRNKAEQSETVEMAEGFRWEPTEMWKWRGNLASQQDMAWPISGKLGTSVGKSLACFGHCLASFGHSWPQSGHCGSGVSFVVCEIWPLF